jgi:uncharacterized protein (TIGR02466 family)
MNVIPLFSSPVYQVNIQDELIPDDYNKILSDILSDQFEIQPNQGNALSKNTKFLNGYTNTSFYSVIDSHIKNYFYNILNADSDIEVYITDSWVNIARPGEWHHKHHHPNSIISGVYYFSSDPNSAPILFDSPRKSEIDFKRSKLDVLSANSWGFPTPACTLYLFPSYLDHSVPINQTSKDRISLSFNTFIKGNINDTILESLEIK